MVDSLAAGLARSNTTIQAASKLLLNASRVDLGGLPPAALAHFLAEQAQDKSGRVVVCDSAGAALRLVDNLKFFLPPDERDQVLSFPSIDVSPFLDIAPDRRATMDRLATLFHLAKGLPFRFLVLPITALQRRIAPKEAIVSHSALVQTEEELDRDAFIQLLTEGGYLRAAVAEDPGSFAVRGSIIDVFPPGSPYPARIELDDYLVMSIKQFDPDDQRAITSIERFSVHPVRETIMHADDVPRVRQTVRDLCDELNMPSSKAKAFVDDVVSGRTFYGIDGLLPAFHEKLASVFDYLPDNTPVAWVDPVSIARAATDEWERLASDRESKVSEQGAAYEMHDLMLCDEELLSRLATSPLAVVHKLAFEGDKDPNPTLMQLAYASDEEVLRLGGVDQRGLASILKARRGTNEAMQPLIAQTREWQLSGMSVCFCARTHTQADRLVSMLVADGIDVAQEVTLFDPKMMRTGGSQVRVVVGMLAEGFVLPTAGWVFVSEEEVFGSRARRKSKRRTKKTNTAPFLQDLKELKVGDYIVHSLHGVGKYLGLERKPIGQSQYEVLLKQEQRFVEVMVVEYKGKDRLFIPVTRMHHVQKFAGDDGHKPKVDKLGGVSFGKKKSKVKLAVKKLADDLLQLYAQREANTRPPLAAPDRTYTEFEATFPFDETEDQAKTIDEVLADLQSDKPMDRLVCGDVGFGKTEVAIRAAFRVAMSGKQVALLCPTTVLAQQHYKNFRDRFADYPINVKTMSRFVDKATQSETVAGLKNGSVDVVIGTHRLLSKDIHFQNLGLLVVDEEQRFGVSHKERMKTLRKDVDVLTLSATPIPRTLQMAIGGLRELSLITTPPVDRRAIRTYALRWDDHAITEAIRRELSRGGQVFFVYNRIEGLYERAQQLQTLMPDVRFVIAHGQMRESLLEQAMTGFLDGEYDVLCSTAIIESGLDIPRANTMIVDRADIFGLSQLYQLRGRVGRSKERAYCYLVTPPPSVMSDEARDRIEALERFTELGSGFNVASLDMELRGVGDLLGAEQSGNVSLIGFELFVRMLEETIATLRGEVVIDQIDPEVTLSTEHFIPEEYVDDVGLRLSFYKRLASAADEDAVTELAEEIEDRFGPPPAPVKELYRAMALKPRLRMLCALGCEATPKRVTLHLREDTPLDPAVITEFVGRRRGHWKLTPDGKLTRRFEEEAEDVIARVLQTFDELKPALRKAAIAAQSPA